MIDSYEWGFATKFAELSRTVQNINKTYDYSYALPADYSRIVKMFGGSSYRVRLKIYTTDSKYLYTNLTTAHISYIVNDYDVDLTRESFKIALAYLILSNISMPILNDTSLIKFYTSQYEKYYDMAIAQDLSGKGLLDQFTRNGLFSSNSLGAIL
jgi:hypothetical protein